MAHASSPARTGRVLAIALAVVAAWTLFGLLTSTHVFLGRARDEGGGSFADLAAHVTVFYWAWAALTPALLGIARRAERARAPRRWTAIALGAPATLLLHGALYVGVMRLVDATARSEPLGGAFGEYLLRHGGGDVATYAVLLGAYFLWAATRRARARELAASALEARLARADLEILRWQLQPHFLFNALNTVSTLVLKHDPDGAERAIDLIARYLRTVLAHRADATVTVAEELRLVERYVEIEALRFGAALRIERDVSDDALARCIPSLVVQPLVENAIHHGLAAGARDGTIRLSAAADDGQLVITVRDPGARQDAPTAAPNGFGLRYVRDRLAHFYGDAARVTLATSGDGTTTTLVLPTLVPTERA